MEKGNFIEEGLPSKGIHLYPQTKQMQEHRARRMNEEKIFTAEMQYEKPQP